MALEERLGMAVEEASRAAEEAEAKLHKSMMLMHLDFEKYREKNEALKQQVGVTTE